MSQRARKTKSPPQQVKTAAKKSATSRKRTKISVTRPKLKPTRVLPLFPRVVGGKCKSLGAMAQHHQLLRGSLLRGGR